MEKDYIKKSITEGIKFHKRTWGIDAGYSYIKDVLDFVKTVAVCTKKQAKEIIKEMTKENLIELRRINFEKNIKIGDYNVSLIRML